MNSDKQFNFKDFELTFTNDNNKMIINYNVKQDNEIITKKITLTTNYLIVNHIIVNNETPLTSQDIKDKLNNKDFSTIQKITAILSASSLKEYRSSLYNKSFNDNKKTTYYKNDFAILIDTKAQELKLI